MGSRACSCGMRKSIRAWLVSGLARNVSHLNMLLIDPSQGHRMFHSTDIQSIQIEINGNPTEKDNTGRGAGANAFRR